MIKTEIENEFDLPSSDDSSDDVSLDQAKKIEYNKDIDNELAEKIQVLNILYTNNYD